MLQLDDYCEEFGYKGNRYELREPSSYDVAAYWDGVLGSIAAADNADLTAGEEDSLSVAARAEVNRNRVKALTAAQYALVGQCVYSLHGTGDVDDEGEGGTVPSSEPVGADYFERNKWSRKTLKKLFDLLEANCEIKMGGEDREALLKQKERIEAQLEDLENTPAKNEQGATQATSDSTTPTVAPATTP